ncbi:hypothetical protein RQP53_07250 [Paucibacter sp. APW11]|uniref:Lipoprotein n=1 Tax=Roseateles aquae TaxID=3077235 RepID=A0ABU3P935_9BURK|nr:hypothetical protein [Paucibacter sp. APW11]MDT8999059.1 hypothetical protein [Paucibacter sp. APW11]
MRPTRLFASTLSLALISALISGCAISVTTTGETGSVKTKTVGGATRFQCVQSPSGDCNYALFTSRCQSVDGDSGKPTTSCTYQVFEEFSVAVGDTREVKNLPSNYKQCMKGGGRPQIPNCD